MEINVYDLDQIDVDGIYELEIKRIKIWEHTKVKFKRQLKSSLTIESCYITSKN